MISINLKNSIYSKKIKKILNDKDSSFNGTSGKVGLIMDAENYDSNKKLTELYRLIGIEKGNFRIVVCGISDIISQELEADFLIQKDVSFTGEFKAESIKNFSKEHFDFLICYFSEKTKIGSLLAAETTAAVKIGNSPDTYGIYDVEIQAADMEIFQQEVLKYIKILKKNN